MKIAATLLILGGAIGCGPPESVEFPEAASSTQALVSPNGVSLNGVSLNGVSLNGVSLNGVSLNGVSLNGVSLNGSSLTGVKSGVAVSGAALVGSTLVGTMANGSSVSLRIDGVQAGTGANSDVSYYNISAKSGSIWNPICGIASDTGIANQSLLVVGTWDLHTGQSGGGGWSSDASSFSVACRMSSVAKCVELGYKPWRISGESTNAKHLRSCVRMLRADYCGDGASWTANGRVLDVWDNLGIQVKTQPSWTFEAAWTQDGADCLVSTRILWPSSQWPSCVSTKKLSTCGTSFTSGQLMMDAYQTQLTSP